MFSTYLLIGLAVQIVIFIERFARGVATIEDVKESFKSLPSAIGFLATLLIGGFINVLTWPISIACEIYNTIKGQ